MVYYFSAEFSAAVKLNGAYLGLINNSITSIKIDGDYTFLEVCPINSNERAMSFILDGDFLNAPPPCVSVTDLKGGYLIKFLKSYSNGEFKVISQQKFNDMIITVYNENGVKISIETKCDFIIEPIPTECDTVSFYRPNFNKNLIAVAFSDKRTLLAVFSTADKIKKVYLGLVDDFSFENEFTTTENYLDMAKHRLTINWEFDGENFTEKARSVSMSNSFNALALPEKLIPYAFLEELLLRGEIKPYLCDNVLENADKLYGFFGEYIGVMPPPSFRNYLEIGLIYKRTENRYQVEYFTFELTNGKISAIKKAD